MILHRYVPELLIDRLESLNDPQKNELNKVNLELLHQLKSTDSAFTLGMFIGGGFCLFSCAFY